ALFLDHRIVSLPDGNNVTPIAFNILWVEDEPINQHNLIPFVGVDPETGRPLFQGIDGQIYFATDLPTVDEDGNEIDHRVTDGRSSIPDIEGGFFTNLNY